MVQITDIISGVFCHQDLGWEKIVPADKIRHIHETSS